MTSPRSHRRSAARAFSLLEMMLVVVIIGILMSVVIVNMSGTTDKAKRAATVAKLKTIKAALAAYSGEQGSMPPTELGLQPLVTTKYLEMVPTDGWKRNLRYFFPSASGNPDRPFDLKSPGADGQFDTADDIDIWTMEQP